MELFERAISIKNLVTNHLISKVVWRLTNAFTLLLIVLVSVEIGKDLYGDFRYWREATNQEKLEDSAEAKLNKALVRLLNDPPADVLDWYSNGAEGEKAYIGLELAREAIEAPDLKINLAGFEVLSLVANMDGEWQADTLAEVAESYLFGHVVDQNHAKAFGLFHRAHELGHAGSSTILALAYLKGEHLPQDASLAQKMFEAAIARGSHDALWRRGVLRLNESSAIFDFEAGVEDLVASANQGNGDAAETLSILHIDQIHESEVSQVRAWLQQAFDEGLYETSEYLGHYKLKGLGGAVDIEGAIQVFEEASISGKNNAATALLGGLLLDGYYLDFQNKVERDIPRALETLKRGVRHECASCAWVLADYFSEHQLDEDGTNDRALHYLQKSAQLGFAKAQAKLARAYMLGDGVEQDFNLAYELALVAAQQKNADAISAIGTMHYLGWGRRQDHLEAFKHFSAAAELGDVDAKERVGHMLYEGEGVAPDKEKAVPLIFEAASAGNELAVFKAAKLYFFGDGVEQDFVKAAHYYRQLAELGQAKSQLALATTYFLLSEEQPELLKYAHMWAELAARQDLDEASQWRSDFSGKQEFLDGVELADACWDANFEGCEPDLKLEKLSMEELWQALERERPSQVS